jgi:hypothetical protein
LIFFPAIERPRVEKWMKRFDQDLLNDDLLSSAAFSERAYGLSFDVN